MSVDKKWADIVPFLRSLFVITDPGRDQDDEDVMVMLNRYVRVRILDLLGAVANLAPSIKRAKLAKGTFKSLGLGQVPVGIGTSCAQKDDDGLEYQFAVGYLAAHDELENGRDLIQRVLEQAPKKSVVLLLISGMTDAADALARDHELFCDKVRRVVIMGGVEAKDHAPVLDVNGFLKPDLTAQNNKFDVEAAVFLHRALQTLGIPMTIISRHAAVAAKVPRAIYDDLADTGHVIGTRLRDAQRQAIEELWKRACLPTDDKARMGLPGRCDAAWFRNTFCGGEGEGLTGTDSIWPFIKTFNLYDPVTLIAAHPTLREQFFSPYTVEVNGAEHHVIGVDAERHCVNDPVELAQYMHRMMLDSLANCVAEDDRPAAMTG
jgi:hypothetical protein